MSQHEDPHSTRKTQFLLACATLALTLPLQAAGWKAGVAKVDITPATHEPLYGYMDRTALSTGTLDPLFARVLVLEAGDKRLALVTLDLGRDFGEPLLHELREKVRKSSGISWLLVTASHTHAGPNILDEYPPGKMPSWQPAAIEKIARAIDEAHQHAVEARLGTGFGETYIGYNRRRVNADGSVSMFWQNPTKIPTSPIDPTVAVLRVDTVDGKPLAILVNYACHPVVFGPDNLDYSADFVGVMCKTVEQAMGGAPMCFFVQGADGDINPYFATTPRNQDAVSKRDWTGQHLGEEAARVAKAIRTEDVANPSLEFTEDRLPFKVRWNPEKFRRGLLQTFGPRVFEDHAEFLNAVPAKGQLNLAVTALLINKRIALMGMPGEPFVDFQINWRDRCPLQDSFFVGYANGYYDYFPTVRAASQGGYGAADSDTYLQVGAGERMVDQALTRIYEMLGRLKDVPEDLKD